MTSLGDLSRFPTRVHRVYPPLDGLRGQWYHSLATPRWYLRGTVWRDPVARNWRWNMYTVKVASFISAVVASDCAARSSLCQDFNFVAILEGLWPELIARCTCAACKCWCYVAISSRIHAIRMYEERCMHMTESHRVVRIGVVIPIRFCIVHELVHQRIYTYRGYTKKTVFFQWVLFVQIAWIRLHALDVLN